MYEFSAELQLWDGDAAWHYVVVPEDHADEIEHRTQGTRRGFGAVRVHVTVGGTTWSTSVFPDSNRGTYLLFVKKEVRTAESLAIGDEVAVRMELAHV